MKYTVVKAVQLPTGTLVKFNEDQAARRAGQLAHVKGKQYECLCPVWVKAGEVIDLDDVAKHVLASLEASGRPEKIFAQTPAAAKAEAKRLQDEQDAAKQAESDRLAAEEADRLEQEEADALAEAERLAAGGAPANSAPAAE